MATSSDSGVLSAEILAARRQELDAAIWPSGNAAHDAMHCGPSCRALLTKVLTGRPIISASGYGFKSACNSAGDVSGLSQAASDLLGIARSTAEADWTVAKAWLKREMEKS